jgi:hypothetical protein
MYPTCDLDKDDCENLQGLVPREKWNNLLRNGGDVLLEISIKLNSVSFFRFNLHKNFYFNKKERKIFSF